MTVDRLKPAFESGIAGCAWILRFDDQGRADAGSAADLPGVGEDQSGYVWLHLDRSDTRVPGLLEEIAPLTPDARSALGGAVDHQFVERSDGLVFGALVDHVQSIDGPTLESDFLRFALGRRFLLTSRRRPLHGAETARGLLAEGASARTPVALFETIVMALAECSARMMRAIATELDRIEDDLVVEGRGRDQRGPLGERRREVVRLARQINGLQSTLRRLEDTVEDSGDQDLVGAATSLAQRADSLARDVANLQDRARALQDEINAILTLETNDRLYLLTVLTAVLLPATLVTGYFGMNTKNLLFADIERGTIYATLICVAASAFVLFALHRLGLAQPGAERPSKRKSR